MSMPAVGKKAPAFSGRDQNGNKVSLADFKGKTLILYFYPQDNTPTCTTQACNLRDNMTLLARKGYTVVGVSPDDEASHLKFSGKFNLGFPLIADPERKIIEKYGVWGEKQMYGKKYMGLIRTTFLVDAKGHIGSVVQKVNTKAHALQVQEALRALGWC
jgi:peroxiredoxin Q/BCP